MPEVQKIQWRRGTAAVWTSANPVLSEGTPGFETDTNKFKVGDGVKDWKTLAYQGDVASGVAAGAATATVVDADEFPVSSAGVLKKLSWANFKSVITAAFGVRLRQHGSTGNVSDGFEHPFLPNQYSLGVIQQAGTNVGLRVSNKASSTEIEPYDYGTPANPVGLSFIATGIADVAVTTKTPGTLKVNGDPVVTLAAAQSLSNKTLVNPTVTTPTINDAFGQKIAGFSSLGAARPHFMSFINSAGDPAIDLNYSPGTNVGLSIAPKGTGPVIISCGAANTPTVVGRNVSGNANLDLRSSGTGTVTINGNPALHVVAVPASATSGGDPGDVAFDTGFMYVCTAKNKWLRAPLATW